jgi:hypothetical protein
MARNKQTARKSTRGPPHPIHQEGSDQTEPKYVILEDDDYYYYNHPDGGWVDIDTEEEPMELPEDHPEVSSGSNEDPAGGDGADPGAVGEMRMTMVTMTQVHPMVVTMTKIMIQSQRSPQAHRH